MFQCACTVSATDDSLEGNGVLVVLKGSSSSSCALISLACHLLTGSSVEGNVVT